MFNGTAEENLENSKLDSIIKKELESSFKKIDDEVLSYLIGIYLFFHYNLKGKSFF